MKRYYLFLQALLLASISLNCHAQAVPTEAVCHLQIVNNDSSSINFSFNDTSVNLVPGGQTLLPIPCEQLKLVSQESGKTMMNNRLTIFSKDMDALSSGSCGECVIPPESVKGKKLFGIICWRCKD